MSWTIAIYNPRHRNIDEGVWWTIAAARRRKMTMSTIKPSVICYAFFSYIWHIKYTLLRAMSSCSSPILQSWKAVNAHLKSKQLLPFGLAEQICCWTGSTLYRSTTTYYSATMKEKQQYLLNFKVISCCYLQDKWILWITWQYCKLKVGHHGHHQLL